MTKVLIHANLYDYDQYLEDAFVRFDTQIVEVGKMADLRSSGEEIIDCANALVIPGFVLAHTHAYSAFARGLAMPFSPKNFQDILNQLWWKLDREMDNPITYASGLSYATDCLRRGVTTFIDHHASGKNILGSLEALRSAMTGKVGLRGAYCFETSDRFDIRACLTENNAFAKKYRTTFTRGLFGLHASMSLSEETLRKVSQERADTPIHIHVAESAMDQNLSIAKYNETVIQRLDRHGLLQKDSLLAHCIHVTDADLAILRKRECAIVVNVSSNLNNAVGIPDIRKMIDAGIPVLAGNDGLSAGVASEYLTLYYLSHLKNNSPTAFSLEDLRRIILNTQEYAERLFQIKMGKFKTGYVADFQIVPYTPHTRMDSSNALGHLFFGLFDSFRPRHVFVGGKWLLKNYKTDSSLDKEIQSARQQADVLWARLQQEVRP